ncbi:hypothetical membrane spanning protein [Mycoplasmopsis fermentans JER]|nr:hypothetical membrane spanning protein [Mycoplasmopsis fermentans JER]
MLHKKLEVISSIIKHVSLVNKPSLSTLQMQVGMRQSQLAQQLFMLYIYYFEAYFWLLINIRIH